MIKKSAKMDLDLSTRTTVVTKQVTPSCAGGIRHVIVGNREWGSKICGCAADRKHCTRVLFCSCCETTQLAGRLGEHCCAPNCAPGGLAALRTKMRMMLGIKGTVGDDWCKAACCCCCVLCQMKRELDSVSWPA